MTSSPSDTTNPSNLTKSNQLHKSELYDDDADDYSENVELENMPLNGSGTKLGERSSKNIDYSEDPIINQLPKELREYVHYPKKDERSLGFVKRDPCSKLAHMLCAVLCCPYSLCNMHVVKQGQIGLTQNGDKPEILPPGRHVLLSPTNSFKSIYNESEPVIQHGPIKIIQVLRGQLGYGIDMELGQPVLLAQGRHIINNTSFIWRQFITLRDKVTKLDQLEIIRVETGYVGYCYRSGALDILKPGLHLITPPDRFVDFLSTQMCILDLPDAVHDTSDYVPLHVSANVYYRIIDPKKALLRIKNIQKQLLEISTATLAGIIRASSLSDVASRSTPFYNDPNKYKEKKDDEEKDENEDDKNTLNIEDQYEQASAPPFFQHVHDEFISNISDHVLKEWGIEIQNIRIEQLKINDRHLQKSISNQAIEVQKQHNRFTMLQKQELIVTVEAQTRKMEDTIETEMKARRKKELAKADGDSIIIKAKAKKECKRLQGQGEKEYSSLIESTNLGKELATMKVQSQALKGLQRIAYVPHITDMMKSNRSMLGMNNNMLMPLEENNNNNFIE